ncbi:MAG: DNA alkylation repair protein [Acidimicrobiia bacterium]
MALDTGAACRLVSVRLARAADPDKAPAMQAYMKTDMSFYGVQKAGRTVVLRDLVREYRPDTASSYRELVLALWNLDHREEKYMALGVARHFTAHIVPDQIGLYHRLIIEGAWWDLVDEVSTHLVRHLVVGFPVESWPVVDRWIDEDDMWLRRTALICQVGAKDHTDPDRLFAFCAARAHEKEFFIRKAIGWALRDFARTDPAAVAAFINAHLGELSGLSYREGSKHISHLVEPR